MKVIVSSHQIPITEDLKHFVDRRLRFALGRFAPRIRSISLRLADVNGSRGGFDKSCVLEVNTAFTRHPVVIRELQADVHIAVANAAERAERNLERRLRLASRVR